VWLKLVTLPLWGLVQQYVLQGFIYRRVREVAGRGLPAVVVTASLFGIVHLPNLTLSVLALAGGLVWTWVYERAPNLFALGISHGLMSLLVITNLPVWMLPSLAVGYKYFH
jgi:membrane protease YdiL (CAAX protease family)